MNNDLIHDFFHGYTRWPNLGYTIYIYIYIYISPNENVMGIHELRFDPCLCSWIHTMGKSNVKV